MMSKVWGTVLTITGFIACPCHFSFTLPLLLGVVGGTGIGGFIAANNTVVYGAATAYFIVGISVGLFLLNRRHHGAGIPKRQLEIEISDENYTKS